MNKISLGGPIERFSFCGEHWRRIRIESPRFLSYLFDSPNDNLKGLGNEIVSSSDIFTNKLLPSNSRSI
jgi:hypothetical protein